MKLNFPLLSRFGLLLFILGVCLGLSLSAAILWGELEARVDSPYPPSRSMWMKCPLLLSPAESGRVETMITNSTTQEVRLFVREYINRSSDSPAATQIAVLSPTESKTLIWMIDSSNLMFNRLILVNILQSQYGDNPSHLGSCGILLFSLFGLGGAQTFGLLFASSLVGILFGCGLWIYARHQLNDWSSVTQAGGFLGALTIAALLSSVVRWWGLILVFDFLILLLAGTLMTEFIVLPGVRRPQW